MSLRSIITLTFADGSKHGAYLITWGARVVAFTLGAGLLVGAAMSQPLP